MAEEEKELTFPITHDRCPVCKLREELAEILGKPDLKLYLGSESRRVADMVKKQELAKKKVREEAQFALGRYQAGISDPGIVSLSAPIIESLLDVCVDCGCVWSPITTCVEVDIAKIEQLQNPRGGRGRLPFFGKG